MIAERTKVSNEFRDAVANFINESGSSVCEFEKSVDVKRQTVFNLLRPTCKSMASENYAKVAAFINYIPAPNITDIPEKVEVIEVKVEKEEKKMEAKPIIEDTVITTGRFLELFTDCDMTKEELDSYLTMFAKRSNIIEPYRKQGSLLFMKPATVIWLATSLQCADWDYISEIIAAATKVDYEEQMAALRAHHINEKNDLANKITELESENLRMKDEIEKARAITKRSEQIKQAYDILGSYLNLDVVKSVPEEAVEREEDHVYCNDVYTFRLESSRQWEDGQRNRIKAAAQANRLTKSGLRDMIIADMKKNNFKVYALEKNLRTDMNADPNRPITGTVLSWISTSASAREQFVKSFDHVMHEIHERDRR